jgi:hypothetical protein
LHVLGTPPALILSQDQTLMLIRCYAAPLPFRTAAAAWQLFNAIADDLALALFVLRVW